MRFIPLTVISFFAISCIQSCFAEYEDPFDGNTRGCCEPCCMHLCEGNKGAVWIFTPTGTSSAQQPEEPTKADTENRPQNIAFVLASESSKPNNEPLLCADGGPCPLAERYEDPDSIGEVWVVTRSATSWTQRPIKETPKINNDTSTKLNNEPSSIPPL